MTTTTMKILRQQLLQTLLRTVPDCTHQWQAHIVLL